jgi:hypothetical protein
MRVSVIAAAAAVVAASVTSAAFAQQKVYDTSTSFIPAPIDETRTATGLSTGFESPFVAGATINGQQGWTTFAADTATSTTISTASPFAGTQHVRMIDGGTNGTLRGAFSPNSPQGANDPAQINIRMKLSNIGGADYDFIGQSPTQAFLSFRMNFDFTGNINVLDFVGTALGFVDTGVDWTALAGQYVNVGVTFVPGGPPGTPATAPAGSIAYSINGTTIYTADTLVAGTAVDQIIMLNDSFQLANETGDWDNLSITAVPEPTSIAALGLVGGALFARRRRA